MQGWQKFLLAIWYEMWYKFSSSFKTQIVYCIFCLGRSGYKNNHPFQSFIEIETVDQVDCDMLAERVLDMCSWP